MRPVAPRTGAYEITIAEEQEEYLPLVAAVYEVAPGAIALMTRWTLTLEERERVARGEDIYVVQTTFGQPMQPLIVRVGAEGWTVEES